MSDGLCRGLVGRFGLVCGPPLLMLRRTRSSVTSVYVFVVFSSYSGLVLLKSLIFENNCGARLVIQICEYEVKFSFFYEYG